MNDYTRSGVEHWWEPQLCSNPQCPQAGRCGGECVKNFSLPLHRTEAGYPRCATCDGGGCPDCTDPA